MGKEVLGGFEHQVLLAVVRVGKVAFTAAVVEELERRTGREPAPAAVYIALQRLERRGLVRSEVRTDPDAGDKRPRRYFRATEEARLTLGNAQRELEALWHGLELRPEG